MRASAFLEEVFLKCDNCGKNFKTAQGLKYHCDQAHQNLPKSHKYKCDQCNHQNRIFLIVVIQNYTNVVV